MYGAFGKKAQLGKRVPGGKQRHLCETAPSPSKTGGRGRTGMQRRGKRRYLSDRASPAPLPMKATPTVRLYQRAARVVASSAAMRAPATA